MKARIPSMTSSSGMVVMVTITSILIWFWANAATRDTDSENGQVRFRLPLEAQASAVIISGDLLPNVSVSLRGPRVPLQNAADRVRNGLIIHLAGSDLPSSGTTQYVDVALGPAIENALQSAGFPVTVEDVDPMTARVQVAPLVTETLPIQAVIPGVEIQEAAEVAPAQARVSMPLPLRQTLGNVSVEAVIDPNSLIGLDTRRRYTLNQALRVFTSGGPLSADRVPGLRIEPANADITFTLASRTTVETLAKSGASALGIPVQVAMPARETSHFEVLIAESDSFLRNVRVSGPVDAIEEISEGRFKVLAFVQLTSDDLDRAVLEGGFIIKPVSLWSLPPGVTIVDPGVTDYAIERERNPGNARRDGVLVHVKRTAIPRAEE